MKLKEAIEAIEKEFHDNYGVEINMNIYVHTHTNKLLNRELAEYICKDVATKIGADVVEKGSEGTSQWYGTGGMDYAVRVTAFFEQDAYSKAIKEIKEILA